MQAPGRAHQGADAEVEISVLGTLRIKPCGRKRESGLNQGTMEQEWQVFPKVGLEDSAFFEKIRD
jgi:hypothetical protein